MRRVAGGTRTCVRVLTASVVAFVGAAVASPPATAQEPSAQLPLCGQPVVPTDPAARPRPARATLAVPAGDTDDTNFEFKRDWDPRVHRIDLTVAGCEFADSSPLVVMRQSFESDDNQFKGSITGSGRATPDGAIVSVRIAPHGNARPGSTEARYG